MQVIWKDVIGYEGLYQVSNYGDVKSLNYRRTGKEHILSPSPFKEGYIHITLCKSGIEETIPVHILVANAFIPNPDNLPEVNHKDENKSNNQVDNLEWCTRSYNLNHGTRKERIREKKRMPIRCYKDGKLVKQYDAISDATQDGFNTGCISLCCNNKRKTYKGFTWKFII